MGTQDKPYHLENGLDNMAYLRYIMLSKTYLGPMGPQALAQKWLRAQARPLGPMCPKYVLNNMGYPG